MSAQAPRNSHRTADEQGWLESSDSVDLSPASVWASNSEEEDETTRQGKQADAQYFDLISSNIEKKGLVNTPRQVRILDESEVLPGEASFATVSLNQPIEESVLKPQASWESISSSGVDDYRERSSASRVQLLDESQVLASEASFATVMLGEDSKAQRYSPLTEFLVKTKLSLKQLVLAMVALVSVLALAVIVLLSTTSSGVVTVGSAPPPTTLGTASQSVSTSTTDSPESILILNSQGEGSGSASPTQAVAAVEEAQGVAETKLVGRASSDDSLKVPSSAEKSAAVRQEILREVSPVGVRVSSPQEGVIETKKQLASGGKKAVKQQAVVKTPDALVTSEPREKRPEPAARQNETPVTVENVETKKPPATGGGERPRTVTRKPTP